MRDESGFKVGDMVRLRVDGSPAMVVEAVENDGRLLCGWKDGAGTPKSQAFAPRSLRGVEPTPTERAGIDP